MSEKLPNVTVLAPISPTTESAQGEVLAYDNLEPAVQKQLPYLSERSEVFFNAEKGSIEEQFAAEQLALQYMLMSAHKLQGDAQVRNSEQLWSDRYTQATSEIYGTPESEQVRQLAGWQISSLLDRANEKNIETTLTDSFRRICETFGVETSNYDEQAPLFENSAPLVKEYIQGKYSSAFVALDLENVVGMIDAPEIANRLEAAIKVLAEEYDADWSKWIIERDDSKDQLSVVAGSQKIIVGMRRASVTDAQLMGLFAHEVLVHALRAVNGKKTGNERLEKGVPGYLDAEEGLGVFVEYAVTGEIPEKNVNRYVDIGLALGLVDGVPKTRQQMLEFAYTRAVIRNELSEETDRKSDEQITKEVYAHINRIYRGSLGNEYIGIFTKDIAYHVGFLKIGAYIESELEIGRTIDEIITYLHKGKFDPTNEAHVKLLQEWDN